MLSDKIEKLNINDKDRPYKLFDIAANLSDEKFKGLYNGKKYHEDDTIDVLKRADKFHVTKMLFAAGCIEDAHDSYNLSKLSCNYLNYFLILI